MKNRYYNYINELISSCLNGNNGFGYGGNDLKTFVFDYAGPLSCVDFTLQSIFDDIDNIDDFHLKSEFIHWLRDVNDEPLPTGMAAEVVKLVDGFSGVFEDSETDLFI